MVEPVELFHHWIEAPLLTLKQIPSGNGGFVALATSCVMYERYATAALVESGEKADRAGMIRQFMKDFGTDEETAKAFWAVIRDGILHQGMPKQSERGTKKLPRWAFHNDYPVPVHMGEDFGERFLRVQPWLVMERVLELWRQNMELLEQSRSFPWASIII